MKIWLALLTTAAIILGVLGIAAYYAFVGSYLWLWFVVPLGVPALSMAHYYGLALLYHLLNLSSIISVNSPDPISKWAPIWAPAVSLAIGYGVKTWLM